MIGSWAVRSALRGNNWDRVTLLKSAITCNGSEQRYCEIQRPRDHSDMLSLTNPAFIDRIHAWRLYPSVSAA